MAESIAHLTQCQSEKPGPKALNSNTMQVMKTNSDTTTKLYIGLDVHKEQTSIALAEPGSKGEIRSYGSVATSQIMLERVVRRIAKAHDFYYTFLFVYLIDQAMLDIKAS